MSVVAMYMLWMAVGPSCLAGLGLLIVISLIIGYIGIKFDEFQVSDNGLLNNTLRTTVFSVAMMGEC